MAKFNSKYKNNSSLSTGLSFIRAYNLWHREIKKQLQMLDITHSQYVVLASLGYLLQSYEDVTQTLISQTADIDVMTVSTILKNLEKKGWVKRTIPPANTRAKSVVLTAEGQQAMTQSLSIVEKMDETFFSRLGKNDTVFNQLLLELLKDK